MKNIAAKYLVLIALLATGVINAQSSQDLSEKLYGEWSGMGSLFGTDANFSMTWEPELNNAFLKLTFQNKFKDGSGQERVMNAVAYYDIKNGKGQWFDSRGVMLPLQLEITEDSMTVLWGDEDSEKGKTIYMIKSDDQIEVHDFVLRDDDYSQFGTAQYNRVEQ